MLVLDIIYLDWIVKKEKSTGTFETSFSCFESFGVWGEREREREMIWEGNKKLKNK